MQLRKIDGVAEKKNFSQFQNAAAFEFHLFLRVEGMGQLVQGHQFSLEENLANLLIQARSHDDEELQETCPFKALKTQAFQGGLRKALLGSSDKNCQMEERQFKRDSER